METAQGSLRVARKLFFDESEHDGTLNQEPQKDDAFQLSNMATQETKSFSTEQNVTSKEIDWNLNQESQKEDDFQLNNVEKFYATGQNVTSKKIEGLVLKMNAAMDSAQGAKAFCDQVRKSSHVIITSLSKLESALNTHTCGNRQQKIELPANLFGSQDDDKCIPSHTYDQFPNKNAKPLINPNDVSYEDDKVDQFDNDSKGINFKPINYCMHTNVMPKVSNTVQMKCKIDTNDYYSNKMEFCSSNFKREAPSEDPSNFYPAPRFTNVGIEEKFDTPLPMHRPMKIPKFESCTNLSYNDRDTGHCVTMKDPTSNMKPTRADRYEYHRLGLALTMFVSSKFPPTDDMQLTNTEMKVCAYVFYPVNDPSEILLKVGDTNATIRDIECLCPGRVIEDKIIYLMALKTTWMQLQHITAQTVWSLPPSFADDALRGQSVNQLLNAYAIHWMPPFPGLKYIYLPIKDGGHWYLMIVSLEEGIVHNLDSCLQVGHARGRHEMIRTMCSVLALMMSSEYFPHNYMIGMQRIRWWEIVDAKGISYCKQSYGDNSALWVLEWMQTQHCFRSNLLCVLNEGVVRMRTVVNLLLGPHNEHKERLKAKAESFLKSLNLPREC